MSVRLSDVAARVGVSEATVSRVLNGKPGVSELTREAVLSAVDVLGYDRPSQLRRTRGRLVGVIVPDIENPIFSTMADVLGRRLAAEGLAIAMCAIDADGEGLSEAEFIDLMLDQHVSGVILGGGAFHGTKASSELYQPLVDRRLPTVFINATELDLPFPKIVCDDARAAELAWRHLRSLGHRHIGMMLGTVDHVPSLRKRAAVERLAAAAGLPLPDDYVRHCDYTIEGAQAEATALFLETPVTAVIALSDLPALGVMRAAERLDRPAPTGVSVVGFDDSRLMAFTRPALTTVRQPMTRMSQAAVRALLDQMDGNPVAAGERMFDPELVVRSSTGRLEL